MIVHRLANGKLYRLDGNVWVEVKPRADLERLDNPAPLENKTCVAAWHGGKVVEQRCANTLPLATVP